jgi:sterol desaturase/sphingolipid hydroxylase (fatty acid hydroxylase superfamily)
MADRDELRARLRAAIPPRYSPVLHLAFPSVVGIGCAVAALALLRDLRPIELLALPVVFLFSNAVEWRAHRDLLHARRWPLEVLYDRHTPEHHRVFVTEDMAIRDRRELRLVLIPAYGILTVALAAAPLPLVAAAVGLRNVGLLALAVTMLYVVSYEWLHLAYHLPADSFIGRRRLIAHLRHHHAVHHDPRLMQRWNFNVTFPIWDRVRGTVYRG